jgi:hypothetical protein
MNQHTFMVAELTKLVGFDFVFLGLGINGLRNILPPLLHQLVMPVLELCGDGLDACDLFNRADFNLDGVVIGAERLGLSGKVGTEAFLRLCENQHPASGETLTQRLNTTRVDGKGDSTANRRIFYDFTFSPPKSVSVAAFIGDDSRILEAHAQAVRSALREFEAFATTRVRASGMQMVCHYFARSARYPHLYAGQNSTARKFGSLRPQATCTGISQWFLLSKSGV